jgi:putative intracellular protease/amidase
LEDEMEKAGAHYSKGTDWGSYVQKDGLLITGQNPVSSAATAKVLLKLLQNKCVDTARAKPAVRQKTKFP